MGKRLCYVFGDGSRTYITQPFSHDPDVLFYSLLPFVVLQQPLFCFPSKPLLAHPSMQGMAIRTYGREVVVVAAVTLEKGIGDNIAEEQQAQVREAHDASAKSCSSILLRFFI
ncbi:hypothetical protein KY290_013524 [Solanum tuberosum]|uniref:Uncharacterized protein n=1 Tax=Solanum tuberosum TaxID=4113 RepID=A0ABQ7VNR4_SOLTU|nr:hypothetical protein KY290_013524 [Solanum tuberosum]